MLTPKKKIKICRFVTNEFFAKHHLEHQIRSQIQQGMDVHLVYQKSTPEGLAAYFPEAKHHFLAVARRPNPLLDLLTCLQLFKLFFNERFDILHTATPKASLLGSLLGWMAGIPIRLHTFTGQVWQVRTGLMRTLLKASDRLVISLNTRCYADSASQVRFLESERVAKPGEVLVLGEGSLSGFDPVRFDRARHAKEATNLKNSLGISPEDFVINFTGRVTKDKGILELAEAICLLPDVFKVKLIVVGPSEMNEEFNATFSSILAKKPNRFIIAGYQNDPAPYFAMADLFALPSYREGFGSVVIEAAMMGVPAVATDISGLRDAVVDGVTGLLVPAQQIPPLKAAIQRLMEDRELLQRLSAQAKERALKSFDYRLVNDLILKEYRSFS